jgi:cytidylate kinase
MKRPIITLDGPAGVGKSTVARQVADTLGLTYLDTGAMYRAVAWKAGRQKIADPKQVAEMIKTTRIEVDGDYVSCDDLDVSREIRMPETTAAVRSIADSPECRAELVRMQQEIGKEGGVVTEGRDQGSVVFPDADHKFYLDASLDVRAERRWKQEGGDLVAIRADIEKRDAQDRSRPVGPLVKPAGAVVIDTSSLTQQQVADRILAAVRGGSGH